MYRGILQIGDDVTLGDVRFELLNSNRVSAYVDNWNSEVRSGNQRGSTIDWYEPCADCDEADFLFTDGQGYSSPSLDPAPWYNTLVRDSDKFFGVVGLEITGAEDSTRSATVRESIAGGGAISRLRYGPRTIVVRGLAVAADGCGLEVGLNFLRAQYSTTITDCGQDFLWFLDCCPSCDVDQAGVSVAPCWAVNYGELTSAPGDCPVDTWWPSTYQELTDGPNPLNEDPSPQPEWCAWIVNYRQLTNGLPQFSCNVQGCLTPYLRFFQSVRVTSGPTVIQRQTMYGQGEVAEIEFTIACADPFEYTPPEFAAFGVEGVFQTLTGSEAGGVSNMVLISDDVSNDSVDPFLPAPRPVRRSSGLDMPTEWSRVEFLIEPSEARRLSLLVPSVTVAPTSEEPMGITRIGIWDGDRRVGGWTLPFVPAGGQVKVCSRTRTTSTGFEGTEKVQNGFARGFEGRGPVQFSELDVLTQYRVTVDQPADSTVEFDMEITKSEKGGS